MWKRCSPGATAGSASALERAWRLGCRFDGWSDHFRYDLWLKAFEEAGVDPDFLRLPGPA